MDASAGSDTLVQVPHAAGAAALARLAAGALDAEEQARSRQFRAQADQVTYRAAHVLLRRALSGQAPYAPAHWRFVRSTHGRPEIDRRACPAAGALRFNLAHTRGLVCCALAPGLAVGIDAECQRAVAQARAIAARFFAAEEAAAVAAAGPPGSAGEAATFLALWTLKEPYVKALGRGLSLGLDGFAFRLVGAPPAEIRLRGDGTAPWRCLLLGIDPGGCTLALALPTAARVRCEVFCEDGSPPSDRPGPGTLRLHLRARTAGMALAGWQPPSAAGRSGERWPERWPEPLHAEATAGAFYRRHRPFTGRFSCTCTCAISPTTTGR